MKRFLLTTAIFIGIISPSFSAENKYFYKRDIPKWGTVYGDLPGEFSGKCSAELIYAENDGSYAQINKNLETGELYLYIRNTDWEIPNAPYEGKVLINVYNYQNKVFLSSDLGVQFINKNSIRLPNLLASDLINIFSKGSFIKIVMPDNVKNISLRLEKSVIDALVECVDASKKVKFPAKSPKNKGETI